MHARAKCACACACACAVAACMCACACAVAACMCTCSMCIVLLIAAGSVTAYGPPEPELRASNKPIKYIFISLFQAIYGPKHFVTAAPIKLPVQNLAAEKQRRSTKQTTGGLISVVTTKASKTTPKGLTSKREETWLEALARDNWRPDLCHDHAHRTERRQP